MILCLIKELLAVEKDQSSHIADLPQPQITSFTQQTKAGAPLGTVPKNRRPLSQPELVGKKFGSVMVISPDVVWLGARQRRFMHVLCECVTCGYRSIISLTNLEGGRTKGCRPCNQPKQVPEWLNARTAAMKSRCNNKNNPQYENYGGRGIQFKFDSAISCALWIQQNLGCLPEHKDMELDRINNDGHYEPGNIRWAKKVVNTNNRRTSKWTPLMHKFKLEHPEIRYADASLRALLSAGLTFDQIVERYYKPSQKPKGKYGTYSIADQEIASLAKGS